jgi:hypothetical protein
MSAHTHVQDALQRSASRTAWRTAIVVLLAVALLVLLLWLAFIGLGALNDVLARGVASLSNPTG